VLSPGQKPGVITRKKSGSALSKVGARKGIQSMEVNKEAITSCLILATGNCPTLPQHGKQGVVLFGLHSR